VMRMMRNQYTMMTQSSPCVSRVVDMGRSTAEVLVASRSAPLSVLQALNGRV